jgi:hypothetical protein
MGENCFLHVLVLGKNLQNQQANFNQNWYRSSGEGIQNVTYQGPGPSQRGDNYKNAKIGWVHLRIILQTTKSD